MIFDYFKNKNKKKKEAEEIWRRLSGHPESEFLRKMFDDAMKGKDIDEDAFGRYLRSRASIKKSE